jgi:hypothetical protein
MEDSVVRPSAIRMPRELKVKLQHAAVDNHRSLNAEMVWRLSESIKKDEVQKENPAHP